MASDQPLPTYVPGPGTGHEVGVMFGFIGS
jgi:hypothetical protein